MSAIGDRIKGERARLKLSQPAFGELAGATKWTVINWEKGESSPDAGQLARLGEAGMDVLYVVTGVRGGVAGGAPAFVVSDQEQEIVKSWRLLDKVGRAAVEQMLAALTTGR